MPRRISGILLITLLWLTGSLTAAERQVTKISPVTSQQPTALRSTPTLATADTCMPIAIDSLVWLIDGWLVGNELYKVLLDPAASCPNPYPFTVTEVHMILGFGGPTVITYSGDIEDVDWSTPSCPYPDTVLGLSPTYQDQVPEGEIYDFWVEFDPPVVVNGPFFAGFYLGSDIDPNSNPALVTDDTPTLCNSYNIWDETVGWVDLANNEYYAFPGRLAIFAVGYSGGTTAAPVAAFTAGPTSTCPGTSVNFTNQSTGTISTYYWTFGDGATSTVADPSHTYTSSGSWPVSLTVTGPGGTDTETKNAFINVWSSPTAAFSATPLSGSAPLTVNFTNQSCNASSYLWQFGDGAISDQAGPSHTYAVDGNYTVTLTATGLCGTNQANQVDYINVSSVTLPPEPQIRWLSHRGGDRAMATTELWVAELSGSEAVDYVRFDRVQGGSVTNIGTDFDGQTTLRNGSPSSAAYGYSLQWNFSAIAEGSYWLKATVRDTLGRSDAESVFVYLEPTPPVPHITSPDDGADFCDSLKLYMTATDENMTHVEIHRHQAAYTYSAGLGTITEPATLSGPAAAALLADLWADRGYSFMQSGATTLTTGQLTDSLAARAQISAFGGALDDRLFAALQDYFADHGHLVDFEYDRNPDYYQIRRWVEDEQRGVIIGLTGANATWLAVDGFTGWPAVGEYWTLIVSDPTSGGYLHLDLRDNGLSHQVMYGGSWHDIDLMIALQPDGYSVTRSLMGADFDGTDGWIYQWQPNSSVLDDSLYFFRSTGYDAGGLAGSSAVLLRYTCASTYLAGDYNDDSVTNILDLAYLVEFVTSDGNSPAGGDSRADANGDGYVNIADVVYFMNYLFGGAAPPTY
ncbi:MAG: PKD domain-containing protein [bacterium]